MSFAKPATGVIFIDDESEVSFNSLAENSPLKKSIRKAISDLKENVFCGESVKKEKIPKIYIKKYQIDAIVDTGAVMLALPQDVVEELGLEILRTVVVTYADERKEERGKTCRWNCYNKNRQEIYESRLYSRTA